jgi:hypothetical protein
VRAPFFHHLSLHRGRGRVHGDKDFDAYHDKTTGPRGQTIASPIIVAVVVDTATAVTSTI